VELEKEERMMRRFLASLSGAAVLLLALSPVASAKQVGAISTDTTDFNNVGAKTTFASPYLPQYSVDNATQYFFIGEDLADGSFYQAGFGVNYGGCGRSCVTYFAWAFDPAGHVVLAWPPGGGVFGTSGTHTYAIQRGNQFGSAWNWYATFDGTRYQNDDFYPPASSAGSHYPWAVSEVVISNGTPSNSDDMGPVLFQPALRTKFGSSWYDSFHASAYFSGPWCPPYNVTGGYEWERAGNISGYACASGAIW
jgi:hypothetical protein